MWFTKYRVLGIPTEMLQNKVMISADGTTVDYHLAYRLVKEYRAKGYEVKLIEEYTNAYDGTIDKSREVHIY